MCSYGLCTDVSCSAVGASCPDDETCADHQCALKPCVAADCDPQNEYCVEQCDEQGCVGRCLAVCACPPGQRCREPGVCEADPCADVICADEERCLPESGQCEPDPCHGMSCESGEICFEGGCINDPCDQVRCPQLFLCSVSSDGEGNAEPRCNIDPVYWVAGTDPVVTDTGCACRAGPGDRPLWGLLLMAALGLLCFRRRSCAREGGVR